LTVRQFSIQVVLHWLIARVSFPPLVVFGKDVHGYVVAYEVVEIEGVKRGSNIAKETEEPPERKTSKI
jgi:hypothetical protein